MVPHQAEDSDLKPWDVAVRSIGAQVFDWVDFMPPAGLGNRRQVMDVDEAVGYWAVGVAKVEATGKALCPIVINASPPGLGTTFVLARFCSGDGTLEQRDRRLRRRGLDCSEEKKSGC